MINLRSYYEDHEPVEARVTYARSVVQSDREQAATLLTGSDDAIRVWLNGKLVLDRLTARAAQADEDAAPVRLRAGKNTLLVEVSTLAGGWGFYLRLQQKRLEQTGGAPLLVGDDGTLAIAKP